MEQRDYKRFLNFLRKHECHVPFKAYRRVAEAANHDPMAAGRLASAEPPLERDAVLQS
jgi:hypothetical protein